MFELRADALALEENVVDCSVASECLLTVLDHTRANSSGTCFLATLPKLLVQIFRRLKRPEFDDLLRLRGIAA